VRAAILEQNVTANLLLSTTILGSYKEMFQMQLLSPPCLRTTWGTAEQIFKRFGVEEFCRRIQMLVRI
jgi:hypothetical protein